ncbi:MAG: tRNA 2-thiouridine(34) synthase MnmA [Parcubacteria group bacterium]
MTKDSNKVAVAMSGGVDSAVAAALLQKAGYEVTGFFMYFWHDERACQRENRCCSSESEQKVRVVAKQLSIPFYTLDFKDQFKQAVVDEFIVGYKDHITPNPCVVCNREIKFGLLLDKVRELGFDYLATGHYVILTNSSLPRSLQTFPEESSQSSLGKNELVKHQLFKAKDADKDQSYFLYNLQQDQLKHLLFPVGKYTKDEVRKIARELDLPVAASKESQDLCFVDDSVDNFLVRNLGAGKEGLIVDKDGRELGKHHGLQAYTIGQRKGIKIGGSGPYYVLDRDFASNALIVTSDKQDKGLYSAVVSFSEASWVSGREPSLPLVSEAVVRYNTKPVEAKIVEQDGEIYRAQLEIPQRAVMPGQSIVFYQGDELIGGGIIKKVN